MGATEIKTKKTNKNKNRNDIDGMWKWKYLLPYVALGKHAGQIASPIASRPPSALL